MLDHFAPQDSLDDDTDLYKQARTLAMELIYMEDNKEFTTRGTKNALSSLGERKAPGVDGITGEIFKGAFKLFPNYVTAIYNGCLRQGTFPTKRKQIKVIPVIKPGKEYNEDVSKFRPISPINVGGKILEKVLINRINYHANLHGFFNTQQYGVSPQKAPLERRWKLRTM